MTDKQTNNISFDELPQLDDFKSLLLNNTPMLDVRAPIEFSQGAFPASQNIPLMNDAEREAVGKQYKNVGHDEAVNLGHQLVSGDTKQQRVDLWQSFFEKNPDCVLYCFRGGMRSKITQQWIYQQSGKVIPRIRGGYKAMRRYLIDELEQSSKHIQPIMLGGRTGIGKTLLLQKITMMVDLEGLFHHRGSVFGKHVDPQPSQIDIENTLSIELLKHREQKHLNLLFEDEAANIGSRRIPELLFEKFKQSPLILLEADTQSRVDITFQEYIIEALAEHQKFSGEEQGWYNWSIYLNECFDKIQRRLGGVRYQSLKTLLADALDIQLKTGNSEHHKTWIESLLVDYYDPMYDYQLSKKQERVIFKGERESVVEFLAQRYQLI